ncbi:MAG: hypothetical protein LBT64_02790, partial [Puniceicoccales bacterium]|nr:hypothetical protein [Puniceicoccales bacterium]
MTLFVLCAISALWAVAALRFNMNIRRIRFYGDIKRTSAHFDSNGNLRGTWKSEVKSMHNFVHWLVDKVLKGKNMFRTTLQDCGTKGYRQRIIEDYTFDKILNRFGIHLSDVVDINSSGSGLSLQIELTPMDVKIPFIKNFEEDILFVVEEAIRRYCGADQRNIDKAKNAVKEAVNDTRQTYSSVDDLSSKNSKWKNLFANMISQERGVLEYMDQFITFSKDVTEVNFFLAPLTVQEAMCKTL